MEVPRTFRHWYYQPTLFINFFIGKTEIDADPIAGLTCNLTSILRRLKTCPTKFFSELSPKGYVTWSKLAVVVNNGYNHDITIQHPQINYNALIQVIISNYCYLF